MRSTLSILLFALIAVVGCKKQTVSTTNYFPKHGGIISSVKLYEDTTFVRETFYEYDLYNRPLKTYTTDSNSILYEYIGSTVVIKYRNNGTTEDYVYKLTNGKAESYTTGSRNGSYLYNNFGYITQALHYAPLNKLDTTSYVYDNDGNCIFISNRTSYNANTYSSYTYSDTLNTIGLPNIGVTWQGEDNKHLLKSEQSISFLGIIPDTTITTYKYELNSDRTVNKRHFQKISKSAIKNYTESYTYTKQL